MKTPKRNALPKPALNTGDSREMLRLLAKSTVWLPRAFVKDVQVWNEQQRQKLCDAHPVSDKSTLDRYFLPELAIAFPFVRRLIASERKGLKSWLHRYHESAHVILDDNRLPRHLWTFCWLGQRYTGGKGGRWSKEGFDQFEVSHVLPHKREMHEEFFERLFEGAFGIDPNLLFLASWNSVLVDRRVAGMTDGNPVVTAVLLVEVERRYGLNLSSLGKRREEIGGINIAELAQGLEWADEPGDFASIWDRFGEFRCDWLLNRLADPKCRTSARIEPADAQPNEKVANG